MSFLGYPTACQGNSEHLELQRDRRRGSRVTMGTRMRSPANRNRAAGLTVIAVMSAALLAQSELVIVKEGTGHYHRPGCPVIRDGRDVIAMTRGQAESREYKQHPACDPAKAPPATESAKTGEKPKMKAPVFVHIDGGQYYHRQECRTLARDSRKVSLEEAGKRLWPCPVCRPPIRKKSDEPAVRIRRD